MRTWSYEREPYRTSLATAVVETGVEAGRPFAVLEDTILYPEGGGQPADRGTLNGVAVLDVQKKDGAIRHVLAAPVPPGPADLRLDWERRFDHMQQHTGQHLLSALAQDGFHWETTAFHLGPEVSDVELAGVSLSAADLARLEEAVAAEIRAARPVVSRRVSLEEFRALPVRTRGLPEGFSGGVRLVEIEGVDLNTCGGTHLSNTAAIEIVALLSTESLRGGTRVFFAAGGRARRRLKRHEDRNAALRVALGAADEALVDAARAKLEQLSEAQKALRRAEASVAEAAAEALLTREGRVARAHFEGRDMAFVQTVARQFAEKAGARAALVTATAGGQVVFALGAGEGFGDAQALGREVAALLGGKGGGSGRVFQGKAPGLEGADRAAARLAAT
ncbi:MAG: alanyl-tRNA editing protein [Acidobacteriota bacterium]